MIIAINQQPYDGPWGGGNRFLQSIVFALSQRGHQVVHRLSGQIDIILMVETRLRSPGVTFDAGGILRYLATHPDTLVVHRINECDERKGEKFITHKLLRANYAADFTVFVGSWLKDLPAWKNYPATRSHVILNGADTRIFHANGFVPWNGQGQIRIVTHHWGAHPNKGFDVYNRIDELLETPDFSKIFAMTYIGKLPKDFEFRNIKHIQPLNGVALADALRGHHAYVTGSINEPGGNHQNEGALCGLPILYRDSGCMPEYCDGYGLKYQGVADIELALTDFFNHYDDYAQKIKLYPHTASKMSDVWCAYFEGIYKTRAEITKARNIWRNPFLLFRNQIPI
jgi:glycosyltransferase involved in cell wall biosynthesis